MKPCGSSLKDIEDFLSQKRIAIVGVSRNPVSFSAKLFEEFRRRGYDVVPVNPHTPEVLGRRCFAHVQEVQPPVSAALLMTAPQVTEGVMRDCAETGISSIWIYGAGGQGSATPEAVEFCRERGIQVIRGECPLMFWRDAGWLHRAHGFLRKITGHYPPRVSASS